MSPLEPEIPPAGEEIHLPGPSIQPLLVAVGVTLAVVGITTSIFLVIAGVLLTLFTTLRWIRDTRTEMNELPLDHRH
jgi:hypothetical protein